MACIYDVIIIGGGTSGLACASVLKRANMNVLVIDQGKPIFSRSHKSPFDVSNGIGGAGLFSDGKVSFFPSATNLYKMDSVKLHNAYEMLRRDLQNVHIQIPPFSETWIPTSENCNNKKNVDKKYESILLSEIERLNLVFWFCTVIGSSNIITEHKITRIEKIGACYEVVSTFDSVKRVDTCHHLVIAGGKNCSRMLFDSMIGVVINLKSSKLELGMRIEVNSQHFDLYNHPAIDVKRIEQDDKQDVEIRTFCCSRDGEVIESSTNGFTGFNGASTGIKTKKSNIGIHFRILPNSLLYQSCLKYIQKYGNTRNKIMLDSFMSSSQVFFSQAIDNLLKRFIKTNLPNSIGNDAMLYYPSIESDGTSFLTDSELKVPAEKIWIIGDATNKFRGILPAMVSGYYIAVNLIEQNALRIEEQNKNFHLKVSNSEKAVVVFTAQSKNYFYCKDAICEYVFKQGAVPVNPFKTFDYFLNDRVDRNEVRRGNNELVRRSDELWVFGPISDGVLFEIVSSQRLGKPIRFFSISTKVKEIKEISISDLIFEPEVHSWQLRKEDLINLLMGANPLNTNKEPTLFD